MSETSETIIEKLTETSETIIEKPEAKIDGRRKPRTEAQLEILKRARIKAQQSIQMRGKTKKSNLKIDVVIEPVVIKPEVIDPVVLEEKEEVILKDTFEITKEIKPEVKYDDDLETKIYNRILERVNKEKALKEKEKENDVITSVKPVEALVEKKPKYRYEDGYTILNV
jgi:hypothetical protein